MAHSITQTNGWNTITPTDDLGAGTPAKAFNDNFLALASIMPTGATVVTAVNTVATDTNLHSDGSGDFSAAQVSTGDCTMQQAQFSVTGESQSVVLTAVASPALTVTGASVSLDSTAITTDGSGNLTAVSVTAALIVPTTDPGIAVVEKYRQHC